MRVAIDAMLLGGQHSGVEVSIEGLCGGLARSGGGHEFLILHRPGYDPGTLATRNVKLVPSPAFTRFRAGRIAWERLALPRLVRDWGADLLHAPGYVLPAGWQGPSVLTVYDILAVTHPEWCKWANALHYRHALPSSVHCATLTVVPSETVRRELMGVVGAPADRVVVAPLGISPLMRPSSSDAVGSVAAKYGLRRPYLLWVGNIEPKKNVEGMVAAFERCAAQIPHEFVLAGRPAWKSQFALETIARSPVAGRIRLLGYVPVVDLPPLYSGAGLLLHWSLYEGAGLTPIEAMACGTSAIVSDGGALPELAGKVAPVVPLGDPGGTLAEAVLAWLADSQRLAELSVRGCEWARQFTWERHCALMLDAYREAITLGPRR